MVAGMGKAGVSNQYLSSSLAGPTSAWKEYFLNEQTIQQTATFRNLVTELRAGLPLVPKRSGNVAVTSIHINGVPKEITVHTSVNAVLDNNGIVLRLGEKNERRKNKIQ